jgi:hypothetical protein
MATDGQAMATPVLEIDLPAPGPARPLPVKAGQASGQLIGPRAIVYGWNFTETTGAAAAKVRLWSGASSTGTLLLSLGLAAGASASQWTTGPGVLADGGVYLEVVSGSVEGAVFVHPVRSR